MNNFNAEEKGNCLQVLVAAMRETVFGFLPFEAGRTAAIAIISVEVTDIVAMGIYYLLDVLELYARGSFFTVIALLVSMLYFGISYGLSLLVGDVEVRAIGRLPKLMAIIVVLIGVIFPLPLLVILYFLVR